MDFKKKKPASMEVPVMSADDPRTSNEGDPRSSSADGWNDSGGDERSLPSGAGTLHRNIDLSGSSDGDGRSSFRRRRRRTVEEQPTKLAGAKTDDGKNKNLQL